MRKTTFTLAEAAAVLSCHKATLLRAVSSGELRAAKLGRGYRISRADLQAFWTAQGGGELFSPDQEAGARDPAEPGGEKETASRPKRSSGPEQLTLPTS